MSVGRHIARLLIDCEAKDGETKKAHLSVSLFDTAYGAAPDERFLAVMSRFSRSRNSVDFLTYLIRYL